MKPIEENVIVEKSKDFSVHRTRPCRFLCDEKKRTQHFQNTFTP